MRPRFSTGSTKREILPSDFLRAALPQTPNVVYRNFQMMQKSNVQRVDRFATGPLTLRENICFRETIVPGLFLLE